MSSRITLARIVFSPPKPSASYNESSRSSVRAEARRVTLRTYVRSGKPVNSRQQTTDSGDDPSRRSHGH
jgi:hypothetical protein